MRQASSCTTSLDFVIRPRRTDRHPTQLGPRVNKRLRFGAMLARLGPDRMRIGIDRTTGRIRAFAADHILIGGGLANFSGQVGDVGQPN